MPQRKYFHALRFTSQGPDDKVINSNWSITDKIVDNQSGIYFTKSSCINDLVDNNTTCMTIDNELSYIKSIDTFSTDNNFCISLWFKYDYTTYSNFLYDNNHFIPALVWTDENDNNIRLYCAWHDTIRNNTAICINVNNGKYIIESSYQYEDNKWYNLVYNREENIDRVFIDGKKVLEFTNDKTKIGITIKNLIIGNPFMNSQTGVIEYDLDQIYINNDYCIRDDFTPSTRQYFNDLYPEAEYKNDAISSNNQFIHIYGPLGFYNADKSRWDNCLDDLEITRPVYWKKDNDADLKMYEKNRFDENNHVSSSNFNYFDKHKEIKWVYP